MDRARENLGTEKPFPAFWKEMGKCRWIIGGSKGYVAPSKIIGRDLSPLPTPMNMTADSKSKLY